MSVDGRLRIARTVSRKPVMGNWATARNPIILIAFFFNPQSDQDVVAGSARPRGWEMLDLDYYKRSALSAEGAQMDALFTVDHVAMWDT